MSTKKKKIEKELILEPSLETYETTQTLIGYESGRYVLKFPKEDVGGFVEKECSQKRTFYELEVLEVIKSYNLEGVYLDCGGYIGNHALFFNKHTKATKVFTFEPNPKSFSCLRENLENLEGVYCFKMGVSNSANSLNLYRAGINDGCCDSVESLKDNTESKFKVEVSTLDELVLPNLDYKDEVVFIKLDIEGHEPKALEGAEVIINAYKPMIYTEIWREFGTYNPIYNFMDTHGYTIDRQEGQHYFWKYTGGVTPDLQEYYTLAEQSMVSGVKKAVTFFLDTMRETYKVFTTNILNQRALDYLHNIGAYLKNKYSNYKVYGFDLQNNVLSTGKELSRKGINNHIYKAGSLEGLSIFTGKDILVLYLELSSKDNILELITSFPTYVQTIREEGTLILTSSYFDEKLESFLLGKLSYYHVSPLVLGRTRYYYYKTTDTTGLITYYIKF